ncbi:metallophosphoesterase [Shewanella sp. VB17]|uniref:metallophosphoesterase n=1 Tax=Shewanella sp. VB17 TaxID=2739432 RepID=UPI001567A6C8|nr:metallophosphoesterase [Shewanella sp. VB17]NRD75250.1 metallophosphoesterase [Shewanella sp. VB17]
MKRNILSMLIAASLASPFAMSAVAGSEKSDSDGHFSMAVICDPQFFWTENYMDDDDLNEELGVKFNNFTVDVINDIVRDNSDDNWQGVIVNGDLTAFGHHDGLGSSDELGAYEDFNHRFNTPVYSGLGNHDYANNVGDDDTDGCGDNGCATDMVRYLISEVQDAIPQNTLKRFDYIRQNHPGSGEDVFKGSMSYSWDIEKVHFVQLNNYPEYEAEWESSKGDNGSIMRIKRSMKWLRDDLSRAIHDDGAETIILNMHDYSDHWDPGTNDEFLAILADYPVTAIFAGHTHNTSQGSIEGVPFYRTGASHKAEFTLLNFTDEQMHITMYDAEPLSEDDIIDSTEDYPTPWEDDVPLKKMDVEDVPNYRRPEVIFYENNSGEDVNDADDLSCYFSDLEAVEIQDATITNEECFNDDAGSVELKNLEEGTVIKVYDSPDGNMDDDYSIIQVNTDIEGSYWIHSLESNIDDEDEPVSMIYNHNGEGDNPLNGKASRFEVYPPGTYEQEPLFVFYEGNNGTQNIVCTVPGVNGKVDMKDHDYSCDENETRSVVLEQMPAGTEVIVFDADSYDYNDDYAEITVLKEILTSYTINSFEDDFNDGTVDVNFHKKQDGDLDGKVTTLLIEMPTN